MPDQMTFYKPYTGNVYVPDLGGVSPEELAFAMSRFSRSTDDLATSLTKVRSYQGDKKVEFFLENYHSYGHASIGDQAPVVFAVQNVSMLSIFVIWQMLELVAGQERSSRYQPFKKTGFSFCDSAGDGGPLPINYCDLGFTVYSKLHTALLESFRQRYPDQRFKDEGGWMDRTTLAGKLKKDPADISGSELQEANEKQADRIRRARAFDIARYLLPLATNTNACYIMSARNAERVISQLLSHEELPELQFIGQELLSKLTEGDTAIAPTLLKYAGYNNSLVSRHDHLYEIARSLGITQRINQSTPTSARVYIPQQEFPLLNIAARLLYPHCTCGWEQLTIYLKDCGPKMWDKIIDAGGWLREAKEDFPRAARGSEITVEFEMDIGAARDMNRHRGCWKQYQWFTFGSLGWDMGDQTEVTAAGFHKEFTNACSAMYNRSNIYALPLAGLIRGVYHMSWPQFIYITELRSGPAGHFAYRHLTQQMLDSLATSSPDMHKHLTARINPDQYRFTRYELDNFFVR